jgi:hypothetical protein
MDITDLKMTLGAMISVGLSLSNVNEIVATITGIVFLVYGVQRVYYIYQNKGK